MSNEIPKVEFKYLRQSNSQKEKTIDELDAKVEHAINLASVINSSFRLPKDSKPNFELEIIDESEDEEDKFAYASFASMITSILIIYNVLNQYLSEEYIVLLIFIWVFLTMLIMVPIKILFMIFGIRR